MVETNGHIVHPPYDIHEYEERLWNDIDREKPKNSEKNLSQRHSFHHKCHMDWPERKAVTPGWGAGD
jgi:hypothetical protein